MSLVIPPAILAPKPAAVPETHTLCKSATCGPGLVVGRPWWLANCGPRTPAAHFEDLDLRVLPYTANHAFSLFDLPLLHADPFDRQIIAQVLSEEIPVMSCDEKFSLYKGLKVLW